MLVRRFHVSRRRKNILQFSSVVDRDVFWRPEAVRNFAIHCSLASEVQRQTNRVRARVNIVGHRAGRQLLVRFDIAEAYTIIVVVEAAASLPCRQLGTYVALVHRHSS